MYEPCNRGTPAIFDVGHGTSNSPCYGDSSHKGYHHIGDPLSYQLYIRIVFFPDGSISHRGT